jgi:hypothetical protein
LTRSRGVGEDRVDGSRSRLGFDGSRARMESRGRSGIDDSRSRLDLYSQYYSYLSPSDKVACSSDTKPYNPEYESYMTKFNTSLKNSLLDGSHAIQT